MQTDSPSGSSPPESHSLQNLKVGREDQTMCLLARFLQVLGSTARLSILLVLARQGELRVTELVEKLHIPQPQTSAHLRFLGWCGYVGSRKDGRNVYYYVADERPVQMVELAESMLRDQT